MDLNKLKYIIFALFLFVFSCAPIDKISTQSESDVFNKSVASVVSVHAFNKNNDPIGQGTGFILKSTGLIATNYHVIKDSYKLKIVFTNGEKFDVLDLTAIDEQRDIAILQIQGFDLPNIKLGNSNKIKVGQKVIAIGNPLGLSNTLSSGIISGIRTDLEDYKLIQTTTPISPGSSGGPLLNMYGEVIGLTTMYLKGGQNLNFAVPINYLIALINSNLNQNSNASFKDFSEALSLKKELADKYYNEEEYLEAAELFREILSVDSTNAILHFKLGYSLHRLAVSLSPHNDYDPRWEDLAMLAIESFTKSVIINPENEYGFLKIARVYGLWMLDAIYHKKPHKFKEALIMAQKSGGFFPFVLEANRARLTSCSDNSILFTNGDDDTFPTWYLQEIEKVKESVIIVNLGLTAEPFYLKYLIDFKGLNLNYNDSKIENFKAKHWPSPRSENIKLTNFNPKRFHLQNLTLNIDHSYIDNDWEYLSISDQIVLDIIKQNINSTDIYFAPVSWSTYSVPLSLLNHTVQEGLVRKIVPQPIDRVKSYTAWENNLMKNYRYSIFSDPRIFGENISYSFISNYRSSFDELAEIYHYRADKENVRNVLKFKDTVIPKDNIPIPWEELTEIYEKGELKRLYEFAGLNFEESDNLDEISENMIKTNWKVAALDTPYYYYRIGEFYLDKKDYASSRKYLREYLKHEPKDRLAIVSLMVIENAENNYNEVINIGNQLLKNDPDNISLNAALGNTFMSKNDYSNSSKYFEKVIYIDKHNYDVYNSYGLLHLYQNKYEEALSMFKKAIEYSPVQSIVNIYAKENIAETYKAMGDNKKAINAYYEIIESDPTMCLAYSKLAILHDIEGKIGLSNDLLEIAKENMWEGNYGQLGLACYYSHKEDIKTSLFYLKTAINMGLADYGWLQFDPDLENLRMNDEFVKIINYNR